MDYLILYGILLGAMLYFFHMLKKTGYGMAEHDPPLSHIILRSFTRQPLSGSMSAQLRACHHG